MSATTSVWDAREDAEQRQIDWLKAPKPPFDFLDFAEAARLIDAGEGEWRTVILLALKTGLRQGELPNRLTTAPVGSASS